MTAMTTYKGTANGRVVELHGGVELPAGTDVEVSVRGTRQLRKGSPGAVLQAVQGPPHLTSEDVDALEQAIADRQTATRRPSSLSRRRACRSMRTICGSQR